MNFVVDCMSMHTSGSIVALLVKGPVPTVSCFVSHNIAGNKDTSPTFSSTIPSPVGVEGKFVGGHCTSWCSSGSESEQR